MCISNPSFSSVPGHLNLIDLNSYLEPVTLPRIVPFYLGNYQLLSALQNWVNRRLGTAKTCSSFKLMVNVDSGLEILIILVFIFTASLSTYFKKLQEG